MRRCLKLVVVSTVLLCCFSGMVLAQGNSNDKLIWGAKIGWSFFQDDPLKEVIGSSWVFGGDIIYWQTPTFGYGLDFKFYTKDVDWEHQATEGANIEWTHVPVSLNLYYKMNQQDDRKMYVGGGLSAVFNDVSYLDVTDFNGVKESSNEISYGFNALIGYQKAHVFCELQYLWSNAEVEVFRSGRTDGDDINIGGIMILVGIRP